MKLNNEFENYLIRKGVEIDNAAFDLINAMYNKGDSEETEWDMEIIGEVVDVVEDTLKSLCIGICRPFTSDERPCYKTDECGIGNCPFKKGTKCNADITPEKERKISIRDRILKFNTTMKTLEKDGYRSGGYDEKLGKTAIVKDGLRPDKTKIVGWVDKDGKVEWSQNQEGSR